LYLIPPDERNIQKARNAFRKWVIPDVGFSCHSKLRRVEEEVDEAFEKGSRLISCQGVGMGEASNQVMSATRRNEILRYLASR